jgi:hypothetical protein
MAKIGSTTSALIQHRTSGINRKRRAHQFARTLGVATWLGSPRGGVCECHSPYPHGSGDTPSDTPEFLRCHETAWDGMGHQSGVFVRKFSVLWD